MDAIREEARSDATREEECSDAIHKQTACLDALREEVCRDVDQTHFQISCQIFYVFPCVVVVLYGNSTFSH